MNKSSFPSGTFAGCTLLAALFILTQNVCAGTACVWRVTNTPAPCYLVGTVHALSGHDYPLPPPYRVAMKDSQQFLFEISPDHKTEDEFGKLFDKSTTYPKGDEIRRHIRPETWAFLEKRFRRSNYLGKDFYIGEHYVKDIRELRPWAIAYFIWGVHGYSDIYSSNGVDHYIAYQAIRAGKGVGGLESPAEHVAVLAGMEDIDSEILLLDTLVQGDKRRDEFNQMRDAWKHGDVAKLATLEDRVRNLNYRGELRLLDYRNQRWIHRIIGAFKTGRPTAIVAGTSHFCGPNNVCDLLKQFGYKTEQL